MNIRRYAAIGVMVSAALALGTGSAWSAQEKDSSQSGISAAGATAPVTASTSAAPVARPEVIPAVQLQQPQTAEQRAGMAKPIKVYWFLSGR